MVPLQFFIKDRLTNVYYKVLNGPTDKSDGIYLLQIDTISKYGVFEGSPTNGWFGGWTFNTRSEAVVKYRELNR